MHKRHAGKQPSPYHALILHGIGGHAGVHWQGWLGRELANRGLNVIMPTLPEADHPTREKWLAKARAAIAGIDSSRLIVVGHSLGATTACDLVESLPDPVRLLVSVSGFTDDYGAELNGYFLRARGIDMTKVRAHARATIVCYGDDDPWVTREALAKMAEDLAATAAVISRGGHLNADAGYAEFPWLRDAICDEFSPADFFDAPGFEITAFHPGSTDAMVGLINDAYRYRDHITRRPRIDAAGLRAQATHSDLYAVRHGAALAGTFFVSRHDDSIYLGLLAIAPRWQRRALGAAVLRAVEAYARILGASSLQLEYMSVAPWLHGYYFRHGFRPTGQTKPWGDLELVHMEKAL